MYFDKELFFADNQPYIRVIRQLLDTLQNIFSFSIKESGL